jgi:hypothetical protein
MKKLFTFSIVCIAASIFFSSCSSSLFVAKRHFNNGYYIAYNKGKAPAHTSIKEKEVQLKTQEPFRSLEGKAGQNSINGYSGQEPVADNNDVVAYNATAHHKSISQKSAKKELMQKMEIVVNQVPQVKRAIIKTNHMIGTSTDDKDGLSLFWIVILVILILWALGFWGFGLVSGVINLLLLIALILLILWLLQIV